MLTALHNAEAILGEFNSPVKKTQYLFGAV